ncbi:hypothetical protein KC330_g2330 [Hortaea werneckii]|nr:hypothetical protein KC330_g2330 [Hortaea werneckii]
MVQVKSYPLSPSKLIPNSPFPLLHYPGLLSDKADCNTSKVYDLFTANGWEINWIFRYGPTQRSHYHSKAHECMAVLSGTATIRFGSGDTSEDLEASTHGPEHEDCGVEVNASAGDVFVIPAGVSHKTFDTTPAEFALLTPGNGHGIEADDPREALSRIKLDGFTMMGAYPLGGEWDFCNGGEDELKRRGAWTVPRPERDPVMGRSEEGLCGLWH